MYYKRIVLDRLLDRYERSKTFINGNSKRRIMLKMTRGDFPEYDIEEPLVRETFNSVILELAEKGLVGFDWVKHETGNIIEKVWLNVSRVEDCYIEIGRKAKKVILDDLLGRVIELKDKAKDNWIVEFLTDTEQSIKEKASTSGFLPADYEQALAILKALDFLRELDGIQCLERVFSLHCFNDSKYFEKKVRNRLVGIIKKYCLDQDLLEEISDDDALLQVGIIQSPELIEFKGGILGTVNRKKIDFRAFIHGISLNADTIKELVVEDMGNVRQILFIENKANYIHYLSENKDETLMIVFHGGFYSPAKGLFFKKLYEAALPYGVEFYHWGDLDLGGFMIFKRLKKNIIPTLKPYQMDKKAFESRIKYGVKFDLKYADKLRMLLTDEQLNELKDVIEFMLEKGMKLEQEAFLI
ncbi:MAG TPA: DUF2399 domain-containing protein [Clostridiales bacterium]|nr:DUF2399 domain-containing protein [Clostridiales bacterium]